MDSFIIICLVLLAFLLTYKGVEYFTTTSDSLVTNNSIDVSQNDNANKIILTLYYAEWCGYCKRLLPEWYELKNKLKNNNDIILVEVEEKNIESNIKQTISGFPTLIRSTDNKKFIGANDIKELLNSYITTNADITSADNDTLTLYYATWCGHCKHILPLWLEFKNNNDNDNLNIEEIESENISSDIAPQIEGFPTAIRSSDGKKFVGAEQIKGLINTY